MIVSLVSDAEGKVMVGTVRYEISKKSKNRKEVPESNLGPKQVQSM
jgi:hypothetical protein